MRLKQEKGITGIDLTIAVILISIFMGTILTVFTAVQKNSTKLERETEAMYYAVDTIENVKSLDFLQLPKKGTEKIENIDNLKDGYIKDKMGNITSYYRTITVQDYTEMAGKENEIPEILKKVTVKISYKDRNADKTVELPTIRTKEE